jgi:predicted SAM-dependent methyltransferase
MIERCECILCGSINLKEIFRIKDMPVFMGVIDNYADDIEVNDLIIDECCECGNIQNKELIDLDLVYMKNHNTAIVGDIWINHYKELNKFIKDNSIGDVILEIGDPSAKLAHNLNKIYKKWIIVEPNPNVENFENVEIIKDFFTKDFKTDETINTIIHSHVLEHMYEPISFLKDSSEILEDDGCIIFSIPNIKWLLENKALPTGILHFEHTYYIDVDNIEYFLNRSGFKLEKLEYYKNHSIFIKAIKDVNITSSIIVKNNISAKFLDIVSYYKSKIETIKTFLSSSKFYLYSAHINTQYLLNNGINTDNIICLLDNSTSKIGKKLYGYNLDINYPSSIENDEAPIVVVSHMGAYIDEIKKDLIKFNKNVIFI